MNINDKFTIIPMAEPRSGQALERGQTLGEPGGIVDVDLGVELEHADLRFV